MKVLVVEDDAETAAYVARGLKEQGHGVDIAGDGRDGLFLALEHSSLKLTHNHHDGSS
jgi:two-component system OmpR family response regulator